MNSDHCRFLLANPLLCPKMQRTDVRGVYECSYCGLMCEVPQERKKDEEENDS